MNEEDAGYPDGGLEAWLIVLGAWCAMVPAMGFLNTLAVLQAWITENELPGLPESTAGWILSTYGFFLYICGVQVGPIFDAYNVKFLVVPGSVGIVLSAIFLSLSREFYQFLLAFGVLGGISGALLFNASIATVGHWFCKRRALATGIACTAGGVGGVGFPLIILYLAPRIGFPWAIRIIGFICLGLGIAGSCLLRKRLPPNKKAGDSIDLKALCDIRFATTTLAVFLIEFAVFIPYSYISSYAIYSGFDTQTAYRLNVLLNVGAIPGRALPGYVADRFGCFNVMCITAATCTAFILGLWLTAGVSATMVRAFTVLFGFWSGAAISLTPVCVAKLCRVQDIGKRTGTAFFVSSFGALTGIPIAGVILQADGGAYRGLIVFAGSLYAAATVAFIVARGVAGGWCLRVLI